MTNIKYQIPNEKWQTSNGALPRLQVLSEDAVRQIRETTWRVLDEVGIVVQHPAALDTLAGAGARVDIGRQLVRFPPDLVLKALRHAPGEVVMHGSDPDRTIRLSVDGPTYTRPVTGPNFILDFTTHRRRKVTLEDLDRWIRLEDRLPNMDVASGIHPQDVPQPSCDVRVLARLLQHTDKPLMLSGYAGKEVRWWAELLQVVPNQMGRRAMVLSSVNSPLMYSYVQCDLALESARHGIVVNISSPGLTGGSSPATLAGSIAQINAETLAAIALIQIAYPGTPVVYSGYPIIFDLQWGMSTFGVPEYGLMAAALSQVGHSYNLPTANIGLATDSAVPDQQAGIEKFLAVFLAFQVRAAIVGGAGTLSKHGLACLEQLAIDDDIFGAVRRQMGGIGVTQETLARDVIARVGPQQSFLDDEHTLTFMRSEYYRSPLANRRDAGVWEEEGAKDLWQRAGERVDRLLAAPPQPRLAPEVLREMERITRAADRELTE
jgi:trimethylamine--corrinoid protein Co-methyltransferase